MASILERSRLPRLPVQPAANSGPNEVSAVKECLVPRFDSNMNPGRSSRKIVACYRGGEGGGNTYISINLILTQIEKKLNNSHYENYLHVATGRTAEPCE